MLIGIGNVPEIPPASSMPKGSLVVMSVNGTEKTDLVQASLLWLGVAFAAGYAVCHFTNKGTRK